LLFSRVDFGGHPFWHRTAACPGFRPVLGIAIFGRNHLAFHLADSARMALRPQEEPTPGPA
jgi:hypothetical protein